MKFVVESIGLTTAGGLELALDLMSNFASHSEHEFTFIVPDLDPYKVFARSNILKVTCKKATGLLQRALMLHRMVPKICHEEKADALLCLGNFPPRKLVCPTVVLLQNAWPLYRDPVAERRTTLRGKLIAAYGRWTYCNLPTDVTVITQTVVMKNRLCRRYGTDPARVAVIPNALSLKNGAPLTLSGEATGQFTFLCLAHYYAHKNIDIIPDALKKLPKYTRRVATCIITIAPDQHPGSRRLLEELESSDFDTLIQNIGPVPSQRLHEVYQSADALLFPTLLESYSRTYLEAMHFGLPILTSDRDFAHYLCQDAAIYFDPLDADSIAKAMARLMEDEDLSRRLTENGRRVLAQVPTWDEIASRFVDVLERAARGQLPGADAGNTSCEKQYARVGAWHASAGDGLPERLSPSRLPSSVTLTSTELVARLAASDVRTYFNREARSWRRKYSSGGKLSSRVEQFVSQLSRLCLPEDNILDLGCGTGELAVAIDEMGYQITACDIAEEMIDIARINHAKTGVKWICLEPDWKALPFEDGSFGGVVASSVFEYLIDVERVAAELSRVLQPGGILLLTVPNPLNLLRMLEAWLQPLGSIYRLSSLFHRIERIDSYTTYLQLSRNRFGGARWESLLTSAHLLALSNRDFSRQAWRDQANAPLILLAVKKAATGQYRLAGNRRSASLAGEHGTPCRSGCCKTDHPLLRTKY